MSLPSEGQSLLANQILSRYFKWRLGYIFYGYPKWLGKGSFFSKSRMCQYPGMFCYILIQKCTFDACRLSLHNSTPSHCTTSRCLSDEFAKPHHAGDAHSILASTTDIKWSSAHRHTFRGIAKLLKRRKTKHLLIISVTYVHWWRNDWSTWLQVWWSLSPVTLVDRGWHSWGLRLLLKITLTDFVLLSFRLLRDMFKFSLSMLDIAGRYNDVRVICILVYAACTTVARSPVFIT